MGDKKGSKESLKQEKKPEEQNKPDGKKTDEQDKPKQEIKVTNTTMKENLKKRVLEIHEKYRKEKSLPKRIEKMKKELDSSCGTGWTIIAGMQFTGVWSYVENTMIEYVDVDDTIFSISLPFSKPIVPDE